MYKNINNSSDYNVHSFEHFQKTKPVKTKFGKDKKAYKQNQNQMKNLNKKDVDIKMVKIDKDTSMKKPNSYTPKKIRTYGKILGIVIAGLFIFKFITSIIEYQIVLPIILLIISVLTMLIVKIGKKKLFKKLKFLKKIGKKVGTVKIK